jgi:NADPH:quinone reductase
MRALVIKEYGGPDVLALEERPEPEPKPGHVVIDVKAFGLNHAEIYFRKGAWGDVAEISGIECVGVVKRDPERRFSVGQKVLAIVGGMGRSFNGSYAEVTCVPASNVAPVATDLPWELLAAIPESYATAWTALSGILAVNEGQTIVIRGATSALGQAAVNIAAHVGARVVATTRNAERVASLEKLGANDVLVETVELSGQVRARHTQGVDAVLDIVGATTILDSLAMLRRGGHACLVGFLGGGGPLTLEPIFQMPSGTHLSVFASALVTGTGISACGNSVSGDRRSRRRRHLSGKTRESLPPRRHSGGASIDGIERGKRQDRRARLKTSDGFPYWNRRRKRRRSVCRHCFVIFAGAKNKAAPLDYFASPVSLERTRVAAQHICVAHLAHVDVTCVQSLENRPSSTGQQFQPFQSTRILAGLLNRSRTDNAEQK